MAWRADGLVCAPRAAPEAAARALGVCPLPARPLPFVPGWPAPPAALVAGWYRRSPAHAPAPPGMGELLQVPGEGFGPADHPTTAMCLAALSRLPAGPALDLGTGSGLLAQAWAALARGPVLGLDIDPRALEHARRSLAAAGRAHTVTLRRGRLEALGADAFAHVVLANLPAGAHARLLACMHAQGRRPRGVLLAGMRTADVAPLLVGYRALGLRLAWASRRGRYPCLGLMPA